MVKTEWFLLLPCEYLLVFFVFSDFKLNIFTFWTVGLTEHRCGHFSMFQTQSRSKDSRIKSNI